MYKLVFRNFIWAIILVILTIAISSLVGYIPMPMKPVTFPLWVVPVVFVLFVIVSVVLFSDATIKQSIIVSCLMSFIYILIMVAAGGIMYMLKFADMVVLDFLDLSVHIVTLSVPIVMSIVITKLLVGFEINKQRSSLYNNNLKNSISDDAFKVKEDDPAEKARLEAEKLAREEAAEKAIEAEEKKRRELWEKRREEELSKERFLEDIIEEKPDNFNVTPATRLDETGHVFLEDIIEEKPDNLNILKEQKDAVESEVFFEDLIEQSPVNLNIDDTRLEPLDDEIFFEDLVDDKPDNLNIIEKKEEKLDDEIFFEDLVGNPDKTKQNV